MKYLFCAIFCFTVLFLSVDTCKALDIYQFIDARALSLGNTTSILPGFTNPAAFGFSSSRYFSLQYINRYSVKELSTYSASINYPNKYLNTGLYVSRFGFDLYNETLVAANFYRQLSSSVSLGVRIDYVSLHYSAKESNSTIFTGDVGFLFHPSEEVYVSLLVVNPLRVDIKIGEEREELPVILTGGFSYEVNKSFLITSEMEKNFKLPIVCKLGFEYNLINELSIRTGIQTRPFAPSFGAGIHLNPFTFDLAFSKHPELGFRSSCAIQYNF